MPDALTNEWTELIEQWNAVDESTIHFDALRARIEAERRRMIRSVALDTVVSVLFAGGAAYALLRFPSPWTRLFAIDVAAMLVATWAFALWNRRGTWRPLGETTESFLRLARLRCRRRIQAIRFGAEVMIAQLVAVVAWRVWGPQRAPFAPTEMLAVLPAIVVVIFTAWLALSRRRAVLELAELDRLHAQLSVEPNE
jgi:hypothetical protein